MLEWEAPAAILEVRPYNEADALVTVLTEVQGACRGLVRGGLSRRQVAVWQKGNLVQARWVARTADQLGTLSAELVQAAAARVMDDALALGVLTAACAVAEGALPEQAPAPIVFGGLVGLLAGLSEDAAPVETLVRWELGLLTELGYGLDLRSCAVTGAETGLRLVSPRTGRAVSEEGAGRWADRLLALPGFLRDEGPGASTDWRDGLALTGHFLARDVFGLRHRPLPAARGLLYDQVVALVRESDWR